MKKGRIVNSILGFATVCILFVVMLTGCQTFVPVKKSSPENKQKTTYKPAKQPKFIKGIYLTGHIKKSATPNAIDTRFVPPPPLPLPPPQQPPIVITPIQVQEQKKPTETIISRKPGKKKTKPAVDTVAITKTTEPELFKPIEPPPPAPPVIDLTSDYAMCAKYTEMVGIKCEEIGNIQLYKFIDKWYGTDYRLGGRTEDGVDCSGFTQKLYSEVYSTELTRTAMDQYKNAERVKHADEAEEGDLVFFKQHGKRITHVGVYLANDYFIHSSTSSGVIISNLKEEYWHKHYVGIGKMPKVEKL